MTIGEFPTSYFSAPAPELDPKLFEGRQLKSWVRTGIQSILNDFLNLRYRHSELWSHPWLAGSGVSYQWSAARQPGDLDCLIGVDYLQFRKANPEFMGLTDKEISEQLNEEFRDELYGQTENWNGYELTFYVNPGATDIRSIKPYAAYDLKYDEWTVAPDPQQVAPVNKDWDQVASSDAAQAKQTVTRFTAAINDLRAAPNDALRRNAQARLEAAAQQGNALYNEIHTNRTMAFSSSGAGYADFHNYRWQAAKGTGAIEQLRTMRQYLKDSLQERNIYGVDLPDASTLVRRAATYYNK
jgi:hypothetical protein